VTRFIWTIKDTLVTGETVWNPADRLRDYRTGRITTRTDSVFSFTAFKNVGGVGLKKNRQAFHIAAIDDEGVIDPFPAALEFVATIDKFPVMKFATHLNGISKPYAVPPIGGVPQDTVGMYTPFGISFHGVTANGNIRAYKFFPLSTIVMIPGQDQWYDDLSDTLINFPNTGANVIPSSEFRFATQCRDDAGAESQVDAANFRTGIARVVVNFDPDTEITKLTSFYTVNDVTTEEDIDFTDGIPDTLPFQSWLRIDYFGWDDARDSTVCDVLDPDKCIDFQLAYKRDSDRISGAYAYSSWWPRPTPGDTTGFHDTDPFSASDSNTVNISSVEYDMMVRSIDENSRPDGTPAHVFVVGNHDPTLDSLAVEDHLGNRINLAVNDTLTWNFWKGEGWPYTTALDTIDFATFRLKKTFSFTVKGWGHDSPKDPDGSGVKAWNYVVRNSAGQIVPIGKSNGGFFDSVQLNVMESRVRIRFFYPINDVMGDAVFANLPTWFDQDLTFTIFGRDSGLVEPDFKQIMYLNGEDELINQYAVAPLGRYTRKSTFTFRVRLVR
jgi:hypothetical protein